MLTPFILLHTSETYPTHESSVQITWQYLLQHLKKPSFVVWRLDSQSDNTKPQQQSDNNKQKHWISQIWGCASFFDSIPNAWKLAKLWSVMMRLLLQIMFLGFVWSMCQWHDGAYSAHPCVLCCSLGGVAKIPAWHLRQFNIKEFILCWLSWMILAALHNGQESKTSMLTFRKLYLDFIGNRHMSELVCFPFFDIVHHVWLLRSWCSQCWRFARPGIFMFDSTFALKSLMSQDSKHTKHSYEEHKSIKDCTHFTHIK